ncbi:MAG: 23S rRNA (pseudouridine(1915)-N(3))-methyltransferase RlmH [Methanoregula sp.]|uniref:23S rRNA (pseudouridine(1915)-N(3))-methyltransferase RlmH n=1 Tax=Methanoregula sp. TaxID=2052170 RepID=UPI003BB12EC2
MQVRIIAVGKIKERYLSDAIAEYEKRLIPYLNLSILEIPEEKRGVHLSGGKEHIIKNREGDRILSAIPDGSHIIALDINGKQMSSEVFAARIKELQFAGTRSIVVVIGGDLGLSDDVLGRASLRLSFSPMTFTHQMVRLILLEQIYRACKINSNEPYHK